MMKKIINNVNIGLIIALLASISMITQIIVVILNVAKVVYIPLPKAFIPTISTIILSVLFYLSIPLYNKYSD